MVAKDLPKIRARVRFPPPAQSTSNAVALSHASDDPSKTTPEDAAAPLARIEIADLVLEHQEARIELSVMSDLWPLWDRVTSSTLEFSGIRLRNARPRAVAST